MKSFVPTSRLLCGEWVSYEEYTKIFKCKYCFRFKSEPEEDEEGYISFKCQIHNLPQNK
jgi:hypothetical protein